jgi:hypothetical protein
MSAVFSAVEWPSRHARFAAAQGTEARKIDLECWEMETSSYLDEIRAEARNNGRKEGRELAQKLASALRERYLAEHGIHAVTDRATLDDVRRVLGG